MHSSGWRGKASRESLQALEGHWRKLRVRSFILWVGAWIGELVEAVRSRDVGDGFVVGWRLVTDGR